MRIAKAGLLLIMLNGGVQFLAFGHQGGLLSTAVHHIHKETGRDPSLVSVSTPYKCSMTACP